MDTFTLVGSVAIAVVGLTTHEFAHAYVANKLGDPTAKLMGRHTLNPLPHIDLFMTILLPAFLIASSAGFIFGGAKPVPVQPHRFRKPFEGMALVAVAGPLSNLLQAIIWGFVLSAFLHFGIWDFDAKGIFILQIGIYFNVLLLVFNMLPIPPLDGSRVVLYFLKGEMRKNYAQLERFGLLIIIGLFFLAQDQFRAVMFFFIRPVLDFVFWITGIPPELHLLQG